MTPEADRLQTPLSISFEGKTYPLAICELQHEIAFEQYLIQQATQFVERQRPSPDNPYATSGQTYMEHVTGLRHDAVSGVYEWTGAVAWNAARVSERGGKELAYLLLADKTPEIHRGVVERMWKDPHTRRHLKEALARSLEQGRPTPPPQAD